MIKVIVVEDEDIIRKALIYTFDWLALGCTVVGEAADGTAGLELIRSLKPELVLTDIKMDDMDGITMLRRGTELHSFQSILITSYSDFTFAQQAIALGVVDYILKPIDEEKLAQAVQKACRAIVRQDEYRRLKASLPQGTLLTGHDDPLDYLSRCSDFYVRQTLELMSRQYSQRLSIESIAATLGVSASYLSRRFKAETSETFGAVLSRYRIRKSIELMETGNKRISEIAEQVGFSDYKHFCAVFKRYLNIAPTEFIKQNLAWQ